MSEESLENSVSGEHDIACGQEIDLSGSPIGETAKEVSADAAEIEITPGSFVSLDDETLFAESRSAENTNFVHHVENHDDLQVTLKPFWENLEQIKNAQIALANDFSTKLKYDAAKQGQIDKLYLENQGYRDDLIEKFKQQLVLAVIEQIDDADKQISHFNKQEATEKNYAKLLNCFRDVAVSFQDMLLERFDVSSFCSEPGTPFDPKRQRALKTSATPETSRNKTVAATLRPGYEKNDGSVVRPEMVEVYRYHPALHQNLTEGNEDLM